MKHSLERVNELVEKLRTLKPLSKENQQKLDKKFRLEFNFNSNHMEGNTLTYGETELLLIFDDTRGNHSMREYEEMKAHDAGYLLIEEWARDKERPLTEQNIKNLNEIILVRPFWKDAITQDGQDTRRKIKVGNYKEHPNSVRLQNGELFEYASPAETPIMMQGLIDWYRTEENVAHPVTLAATLHYKFVRIHPFDDGNGRIARLLMNYVLLKNDLPPVVIKSKDKASYLRALHAADVGDFETFIEYISEQVEWSLETSIKAALGQSIEDPEDWEKELILLKQEFGQEKDTKVEVKYNHKISQQISKQTIEQLISNWEAKLDTFDSLFKNRNCRIILSTKPLNVEGPSLFNHNSLKTAWNDLLTSIKLYNLTITRLRFFCEYEEMIIPNKKRRFTAGDVKFSFYDNAYEIEFNRVRNKITLSYSQFLSSEEINEIVNTLSRDLMRTIKEAQSKQSK